MSLRPGRSRGVFVVGGAALVALGIWFGGMFDGLGWGVGEGNGSGNGGDNSRETAVNPDGDTGRDPAQPGHNGDDPLRVVLESDGYALAVRSKDGTVRYAPATAKEVVTDAVGTKEQPDGYRVVITSRAGVSAGAHQDLVRQLEAAGLKPDEILGYDSKDVAAEE